MSESLSEAADSRAAAVARRVADLIGTERFTADFGTAKVHVRRDHWVEAHRTLRDHLPFFSWLSATDWAEEVAVGDPPEGDVVERYEVMTRLADVTAGDAVILTTDIPKEDAWLDTLREVFGGADWHEREAHEMFGIDFRGHPNLAPLYLPDGFEGHPLRKSYPLLSREVKPWPGTVDVEDMPAGSGDAEEDAPVEDGEE